MPVAGTGTTTLSPGDFSAPASFPGQQPAMAVQQDLTPLDRATLKRLVDDLTAARAAAKSDSAKTADLGNRRIHALMGYLVGFCDSHGFVAEASVRPGFEQIFGADARPDLDSSLDDLQASLTTLATEVPTRINWSHAIGAVLEGAGMVLVAIAVL